MAEKKNALLVFTKPPLPGIVKTRMTTEYGGFFTMKQAAEFYRFCFFDVCDMGMTALLELQEENDRLEAEDPSADKVTYDFYCSTTPTESLEKMEQVFASVSFWKMEPHFIVDKGSSFDEHFNDAFNQLFELGYESVVSVGGDLPTMPKRHIKEAFTWLDRFQGLGKPGFVCAPCQECGTSLVGYSHNTPIDHSGVYYNLEGRPALDGYVDKLREADVPSAYFDPVADIDVVGDLGHAVSCMKAIREAARYQDLFVPRRALGWCEIMGIQPYTTPNENHDPRDYLDVENPDEAHLPDEGDRQRIADLNAALQDKQAAENAYEAAKY
jgi:glycosyltransferase A (GT-A) superfamily protein (DUF2064 family)